MSSINLAKVVFTVTTLLLEGKVFKKNLAVEDFLARQSSHKCKKKHVELEVKWIMYYGRIYLA